MVCYYADACGFKSTNQITFSKTATCFNPIFIRSFFWTFPRSFPRSPRYDREMITICNELKITAMSWKALQSAGCIAINWSHYNQLEIIATSWSWQSNRFQNFLWKLWGRFWGGHVWNRERVIGSSDRPWKLRVARLNRKCYWYQQLSLNRSKTTTRKSFLLMLPSKIQPRVLFNSIRTISSKWRCLRPAIFSKTRYF